MTNASRGTTTARRRLLVRQGHDAAIQTRELRGDKFQKTTLENVLPGPTATSLLPILVFLRSGKRMMSSHAAHKARMDRVTHIHRPCEDNKPWQCRQQLPADSRGRAHLRPMLLDM